MSKVEIQEIEVGSIANAADANATLTSWNTNTAADTIDEENVRDEGLDATSFGKPFAIFGDTVERTAINGNLQTITATTVGTAELSTPLHVGGFDFSDLDGTIEVSVSVEIEITFGGASPADYIQLSLGQKTGSGGAPPAIPQTTRRFTDAFTGTGINGRASYTVVYTASTAGGGSDHWFTLLAWLPAGAPTATFDLNYGHISAVLYRRSPL
jgi:hypothetical protein